MIILAAMLILYSIGIVIIIIDIHGSKSNRIQKVVSYKCREMSADRKRNSSPFGGRKKIIPPNKKNKGQ